MMLRSFSLLTGLLVCCLLPPSQAAETMPVAERVVDTSLADYVARPDASYGWVERREGSLLGTRYVELTLTSQTWRDITWKHQLFVIKPSSVPDDCRHALLFITGGSWRPELERPVQEAALPREASAFAALAQSLRTPVAVLLQVPHQPILDGKYEDQIIAYTFQRYLETGDSQWPLLLPMVKSAVRGMDAVGEVCQQKWSLEIDKFTVSGASKRGWTTWLTAAVDPRVTALAPMVIDMLNMKQQIDHQRATWGKLSHEIDDYSQLKLDQHLDTPRGRRLQAIVDPYQYRQVLQQPKLIMLGTNDDYWPLDALNLYWKDLVGPKYILYVPNNRHGLKDLPRLLGGLNALHHQAANGFRMPNLNWDFRNGDSHLTLEVAADVQPVEVLAWVATSASRDFRQAEWQSRPAEPGGAGAVCRLKVPDAGYAALFAEARFDGPGMPLYLSTNVRIIQAEKQ